VCFNYQANLSRVKLLKSTVYSTKYKCNKIGGSALIEGMPLKLGNLRCFAINFCDYDVFRKKVGFYIVDDILKNQTPNAEFILLENGHSRLFA